MYTDEERLIFQYYDGAKHVYGDPWALYRQILIATGGKPHELDNKVMLDLAEATPEQIVESSAAHQKLCLLTRDIFKMKPFNPLDNTGAMDEHCLMAWRSLAAFLYQKKTSGETLPTESAPTDGSPDSPTATASTSD